MPEQEDFNISFEDVLTGGSQEAPANLNVDPPADPPVADSKDTLDPLAAVADTVDPPVATTDDLPAVDPDPTDTLDPPANDDDDNGPSIVGEIKNHFGYELEEDYEDTPEGLQALTKALAQKMSVDNLDTIFDKYPTVKDHLKYVQQGGDPQQFLQAHTPEVEYSNVEIKDDDINTQKALVEHYFASRGDDKAFVQDRIEAYEDKGTLKDMATRAKNSLVQGQSYERETLMENQRLADADRTAEAERTWGEVTEIVTKNEAINGLPIAQKERNKFLDYISKQVDRNGNTQRDIDSGKLTLEQQLGADYLLYKGMKLDSFIGKKAGTKAASNLRERMQLNSKKAKGTRTVTDPTDNVVGSLDLNLDNFGQKN